MKLYDFLDDEKLQNQVKEKLRIAVNFPCATEISSLSIEFSTGTKYTPFGFCWCITRKPCGYVHPMIGNSNNVQTFKTFNGLIKSIKRHCGNIECELNK